LVGAYTAYRTETDKEYHKMTKRLTMVLVISVALAISSPAVVGCQSEESTTTEDATTTQERGTTSQDATTTASSSTVGPETLTTLTAWGENFFGQLGNGVTLPYGSHSNTPVEVSDLEGAEVKAISGGQLHSLALKDDDIVWAWGYNQFG
jgi:alpha-tubulin suppressor-like RCC1 family protein